MKTVICNAAELWQKETSLPSIPTFSQRMDNILGNDGIHLGSVSELLGLPGTGKTQLSLQLCASVQIPKALGGLDAEALYIDTNTNFTLSRYREILKASLQKCHQLLGSGALYNEERALDKLHYANTFGLEKYCAFMNQLPKFILEHPDIRLIVIDSISFPFKEGISTKRRTGLLFRQMAELQRIAIDKQIAVVLTGEMSTRVGLSGGAVVGALGDGWAHRANTRVLLSYSGGTRLALLDKSSYEGKCVAEFQITSGGIRDVE